MACDRTPHRESNIWGPHFVQVNIRPMGAGLRGFTARLNHDAIRILVASGRQSSCRNRSMPFSLIRQVRQRTRCLLRHASCICSSRFRKCRRRSCQSVLVRPIAGRRHVTARSHPCISISLIRPCARLSARRPIKLGPRAAAIWRRRPRVTAEEP